MKNRLLIIAALWLGAVTWVFPQSAGPGAPSPSATLPSAHQDLIATYCTSCHNERLKTAGLALDRISRRRRRQRGRRLGEGRPQGARRVDAAGRRAAARRARRDALVTWLETELDRAWAARPNPGRPLLRRLNRAEYANAVRDLLASRWMSPRCCRRMIRPTASTTSPMP